MIKNHLKNEKCLVLGKLKLKACVVNVEYDEELQVIEIGIHFLNI